MTLRRIHRLNALALGLFLGLHLANHATLLGGTGAHLKTQAVLAPLYRWLPLEALLLALFATQIVLGLWMGRTGRFRGWRRVQLISGLILALFLVAHVGAVLTTRLGGLETNIHFAAAGFYHPVARWFFVPYYLIAVTAIATHLIAWMAQHRRITPAQAKVAITVSLIFAIMVLAGMMGAFGGPPPPADYLWAGSGTPVS